ncbi:MAG: DegV family protein [Syntrophomonadaceae bacterium]|jgi:DegV family protein with EDD domain|nr:DegV family protein [Syntrophomonadaceae bacterium]
MVKITADSTCDLSENIIKAMNITLIPLHIIAGEQVFRDGVDITPPDIFRLVEQEEQFCKTSAVNVYQYVSVFQELSPQYEAIIHICIGSEFSTCYQNACLAAGQFNNVYVIDSRNLSTGSGHIVYDAAVMAQQGKDPTEICRTLDMTIPKVEASFVIDRLDYLHKGGRCSGLEAVGAKILNIKPCIEVVHGKMKVGKKYRGSFEHCLEHYVKDRLSNRTDIDYSRIFITHPVCADKTVARVKELVDKYADFEEVIETRAGCTISSHCGPNTLGILFKRKV